MKVEDKFSTVPDALNLANNNMLCKHATDSTTTDIPIPSSHVCKLKTEIKNKTVDDLVPYLTRDGTVDNNDAKTEKTEQIKPDTGQIDCSSDDSQDSLEVLKCDSTLPYSDEQQDQHHVVKCFRCHLSSSDCIKC